MGTSSIHQTRQSTANTNTSTVTKTKPKSRSTSQKSNRLYSKALRPALEPQSKSSTSADHANVDDSLAICLLGYTSTKHKMYDSEYEEEVRKQAVMQEVLPDAVMWKRWEATEAPLRQGRGWYPTLDRHFLELLVISEIHCLSHPLQSYTNFNPGASAERIHRHASRVRRVACDRIGAERLHAYCDRVKEAFEAYVQGGWGHGGGGSEYITKSEISDDVDVDGESESSGVESGDEPVAGIKVEAERGRGLEREGSALKRRDLGPSPPSTTSTTRDGEVEFDANDDMDGDVDVSMVVDVSPPFSPIPSLSLTDSDGEDAETQWDEGENMHKVDLEGVVEVPEDEADEDNVFSGSAPMKVQGGMDVDIVLGEEERIPKIHIITPSQS